ncbi:transporter substrate-binding domain-containing protein [Paraburkholderia unamae]|uniref:Amino acid ABC transporter substrate-binding protein (PAAT family) n=1 Tax=Paraburkholderia unamae TaxID=219649 RepID=A0ABX5K9T8_9BURK|nr:transporter substrate-binding domain-containing protein [Paraburkholderia unamae]PVX60010.1 amino acid ABC transporter substrate-binding protein (PAAT family) [Paraburkholderia unamae]CAG9274360.1 Amino acid ABC transporter substrate-binding protein, PAAT family [Paraburkholderia unamae]
MNKTNPCWALSIFVVVLSILLAQLARADEAAALPAGAAAPVVPPNGNATATRDGPLRVAIAPIAPFVVPQSTPPQGFSIDIWNEVARRMRRDFTWRPVATLPELLAAVQQGNVDLAIAAITMTPQREGLVDFSMPYFDSGLQIMVRARDDNSFMTTVSSIPWRAIGQFVAMTAAVIFLLANLVWLMERKRDKSFQKPYWRALGEGLWVTMLIIATGEHGERDAPGVWRRMLVPAMWLIGVVLVAQLTATVTSSQTVARLQSSIQGPDDLPGKLIATVPGTVAADYLRQRGLPFVDIHSADDGFRMLMRGDVQAIVYDAPTLQYWAARTGKGVLAVVGPVFRPEKYGIALPNGSPLRKAINETLLSMYEDGTYEQIYRKWFSSNQ